MIAVANQQHKRMYMQGIFCMEIERSVLPNFSWCTVFVHTKLIQNVLTITYNSSSMYYQVMEKGPVIGCSDT